ncbi:MAG: DUF5985 family protein [Kofleriaceae bacterium]
MTGSLLPFLHGAVAVTCLAIGLKFLKYYRLSQDRFFVWFAVAFFTFGGGATWRVFSPHMWEHAHLVFLPRLAGFVLILIAIIDKNRHARK